MGLKREEEGIKQRGCKHESGQHHEEQRWPRDSPMVWHCPVQCRHF